MCTQVKCSQWKPFSASIGRLHDLLLSFEDHKSGRQYRLVPFPLYILLYSQTKGVKQGYLQFVSQQPWRGRGGPRRPWGGRLRWWAEDPEKELRRSSSLITNLHLIILPIDFFLWFFLFFDFFPLVVVHHFFLFFKYVSAILYGHSQLGAFKNIWDLFSVYVFTLHFRVH